MPATLRFYLVDAFAEQPYRGNVAGVVFDADALSAVQIQRIASEIHASETAFLSRANDLHRPMRIRWFTPTTEVGFCGHATLASAHALHEAACLAGLLSRPDASLVLDSAAGELRLRPETLPEPHPGPIWWLDMPDPALKADHTNPIRMCELLGLSIDDLDPALPAMRSRDDDVIYIVRRWQTLMDLRPDFAELARWCERNHIRGLCVATTATLAESVNVHSRFFAPAAGVNEDPVTGSVHGPLAVYLVVNGLVGRAGGRSALLCAQGRPGDRSGLVRALVESTPQGYRVRIAGQCFTTLTGELRVPPE
jgi:trans-2,3-dihydro-3-hydroxyanthranilate isomerase